MSATNVKSKWVDGNLQFLDKSGNTIATFDGTNRKLTFPEAGIVNLPAGEIEAADLAADAVTTVKIADSAITAAKIAADAVTTAKIADANVTAAKLAADSVETAKIKDANVTNAKKAEANSYLVIQAHKSSVAINQSDVEVFEVTAPAALTLTGVQVYCTATVATASVDVKEAGTTVLSAAITPSAGTVVAGVITDAAIANGAAVTVHVTTDGSGTITDLTVTLICKTVHVA